MANPVSKTAYYCTGVRMLDAQSNHPLIGDRWAERFMDAEGHAFFDELRPFTNPTATNIVRHHIIDEILKSRLASDRKRRIVLLGAGFDSRALRLSGGEWFEVDEAAIVERKNERAPAADAQNPLQRIPIEFGRDDLVERLAPLATERPVTVVMEGVLYYLESAAVRQTAAALHQLFPEHDLVCDLQSDAFVRRWGGPVVERITSHGAPWRFHPADPARFIEELGYRRESSTSIPLRAAELGRVSVPSWVIRWVLRSLRDGYCVHVFSRRGSGPAAGGH